MNEGMDLRTITKCRVCGLKELDPILSLGSIYISDFVTDRTATTEQRYPLDLVLCDPAKGGCGLLQLRHTVNPSKMYNFYYYHSGANRMMREALADITAQIEKRVALKAGDLVLDIGCNDGTLLRSYRTQGLRLCGIDPAKNLLHEARVGTTKVVNDYFNYKAFAGAFPGEKAKAISSIAMFYDLDDPNEFVSDIVKCLAPDGIWVIQMSYLPLMLETNAFDNICHEHLEYYSLLSLEALLRRHRLKAVDVELNDVNGGSFRVYVKHEAAAAQADAEGLKRISDMEKKEKGLRLTNIETYRAFASRIDAIRGQVCKFIREAKQKGKTVCVYGASTKGNTLLQYFNLDNESIKLAAERNPDKYGKKTVGSWIPIVSEEEAHATRPDFFLVLPWHFLQGFVEQEKKYLSSGGRFIVPLPKFEIIPPMDA